MIVMMSQKEDNCIRINDKLATIDNHGNWLVGGVQASRKLSNFLDGIYKEVTMMADGAERFFNTKI